MTKKHSDRKAAIMIGKDDEMLELKGRCVPLIFDCPRKSVSAGCPFDKIRKDDVVNRVKWVKAMSGPELRAILKHHTDCISKGGE
jgi:hypothetical protein